MGVIKTGTPELRYQPYYPGYLNRKCDTQVFIWIFQKRLTLNHVFNIAVITHLAACQRISGLDNPGNKGGTLTPVYLF